MGRNKLYTDETRLVVRPNGKSRLQPNSDRRAIVSLMIENGGIMSLKQLDDHYKFSIRDKAIALVRAGWLAVKESK